MGESNRLTARFVDQVKTPGVYRDGAGLLLRVEVSGSKRWVLRFTVQRRRRDVGLGSARQVSLREARESAFDLRRVARSGKDPISHRRSSAASISFKQAAERVHQQRQKLWRNAKHSAQWLNTLILYAFPLIGRMPVREIQAHDVLRVLDPIWLTKPETARRVRQRIRLVLDWAVTAGHRSNLAVNAADAVRAGLPRQPKRHNHHRALPWRTVPKFVAELRRSRSAESARYALEFLVLTAARTAEVLGARWPEVSMDACLWTVPADRMKGGTEHRVPLSAQAMRILQECRARWPDAEFIFPGRGLSKPLSNMTLLMLMRRLDREEVPHGLRSSFRDWAAENRKDRDAAEAALAHALNSATEAAYCRTDLLEARRTLMDDWAKFVDPPHAVA